MNEKMITVAVTGANGQVGRKVLELLEPLPVRTIAITRGPDDLLPVDGHMVGDLAAPEIQAMLSNADYIIHLAGTLRPIGNNSYKSANVETTQAVAAAVRSGRTRRVVFLSYIGASDQSKNAYLRTKGIAEQILCQSQAEVIILRCPYIIGSPDAPGPQGKAMLVSPGKAAFVLGNGSQKLTPVYSGDVARILVATIQRGKPGLYELAGPEGMSMDDLVRLVNRNPAQRIFHLPAPIARLMSRIVPGLPAPMVDLLLRDSVGDGHLACREFGIQPCSLKAIWSE